MAPLYGQVIAGPPGSGKTTYCAGMQEYLRLLGRDAWVINLDPANEVPKQPIDDGEGEDGNKNNDETTYKTLPYDTLLDVCESVVNLSSVMKQLGLGPNGGLVYCMEYLQAHVDEVVELIRERVQEKDSGNPPYLILDLPGQVELYTHGTAVPQLLQQLVKVLDLRLVAVQLVDAQYCTEPSNFLSAALLGTTTMLRLELPTVNVLSKVDLLAHYGTPLPLALDFFTDCQDLDRLLPYLQGGNHNDHDNDLDEFDDDQNKFVALDDEFDYTEDADYQRARKVTRSSPFFTKHKKLHKAFAEVVDDFGLLSFLPLDISNAESVGRVLAKIDKSNGYIFVDPKNNTTNNAQDLFQCAVVQSDSHPSNRYESIADIQENLTASRQHQRQQQLKGGHGARR